MGDVNYRSFLHLLNSFHHEKYKKKLALTTQELQGIPSIAQSDSEREAVRYTAFKVSGLSATGARKHYGFHAISERAVGVKDAIAETKAIHSAFEGITKVQEAAVLSQFGVDVTDLTDSSNESEVDYDDVDSSQLSPSTSKEKTWCVY